MIKIKLKKEQWQELGWWNKRELEGDGYLGVVDGLMECHVEGRKKHRTRKCIHCGKARGEGSCTQKRHQYFYWK